MQREKRGLTLIELLVAMAIIVLLTAFLIPQVSVLRRKSYIRNTEAFIKKLETALKLYYDQFRDFPPDGYDAEAGYTVADGIQLGDAWADGQPRIFKGTGTLVYFLCLPVTKVTIVGSYYGGTPSARNLRFEKVGPFLDDLKAKNYTDSTFKPLALTQAGGAALATIELVDAWGRPLSYDKITKRENFFQAGLFDGNMFLANKPHWPINQAVFAVDEDVVSDCDAGGTPIAEQVIQCYDPRRPDNPTTGCIDTTKPASPKNVGNFDIWSHGQLWSDPADDICSWKLN